MISMFFVAALITGLIAGVIAGLFGVGGGIIIVPALLVLYASHDIHPEIIMHLAVGTSLATIVVTNISATFNHHRRGAVDWKHVLQFIPGILLGAWLGSQLAAIMNGSLLRLLFGCFEIIVGLEMLRGRKGEGSGIPLLSGLFNPVLGLLIGTISSLFGIGGGTLAVPVLNLIRGLPMLKSVGSASAMGFFLACSGAMGYIQAGMGNPHLPPGAFGFILPQAFLGIVCGTLLTTPIGVRLAHALPQKQLKRGFGLFLIVIGIKLIMK
ncbi:MAG: sulfite exporter TauE/SafE family protein [Magnetococcales bacterium]|nr:sulfite exporter TauE/SafE family protein [Magnetococcales bacterium]MBF0632492.1 sulfite exporter TauE/SafE family protein [Magnetococcales bacterium]